MPKLSKEQFAKLSPAARKKRIEDEIRAHNYWVKMMKKEFKKVTWADQELIGQVTLPRRYGPNVVWTQR